MEKNSRIYIAGHGGLLGSALEKVLKQEGYKNLVLRTKQELDLRSQLDVLKFFESERKYFETSLSLLNAKNKLDKALGNY